MQKHQIVGLELREVQSLVKSYGFDASHAHEICTWIYRKACRSFFEINSIPLALRHSLDEDYTLDIETIVENQQSLDGTKKYLFKTFEGNTFETAFMPGPKRNTLCISTQSGCRMGCSFCFTGKLGFKQNLSSAQIVGQLLSIPERPLVNRIVIMGMGEPLDNSHEVFKSLSIMNASWGMAFGASNITLSTIGLLPKMNELVELRMCNIAISLHSPFAAQRHEMMPVEKDYPIEQVVDFFRRNPLKKPLRLSFEYIVIPGENDSVEHANATSDLLNGLTCHVNVIPLNTANENSVNLQAANRFQRILNDYNQPTTLRLSRGFDIDAACGMMAGKDQKKKR